METIFKIIKSKAVIILFSLLCFSVSVSAQIKPDNRKAHHKTRRYQRKEMHAIKVAMHKAYKKDRRLGHRHTIGCPAFE